jgi:mono/diheme cytochrome c family protein
MLSSATSRSGKKSGQRIVASSRSVASKTPSVKEKEIGARGDEIVNDANKSGSQDSTDTAQTADSMAASTCSTCHTGMRFICSWFG